jgi:hypothetical protein
MRLPIPAAYFDPAFMACVNGAIDTRELVEQFDRLYGASLARGKAADGDMRAFLKFVHDSVYLRLPDEAIHSLRASADTQEATHG